MRRSPDVWTIIAENKSFEVFWEIVYLGEGVSLWVRYWTLSAGTIVASLKRVGGWNRRR